uniref:Fringe-like glycosyltransferase domain-containing protein n=1 Tax=Timema shepardi TaxID=629360 RepID=A0A7R9B0L6_TIMSH|nr:unnamed protein product [Timema shepardi]
MGGGKFISIGEKIRLPDDVTMGYIIDESVTVVTEHLLRKPLTVIDKFHSHLEPMKFLRQDTFHQQITFSYSRYSKDEMNVLKIDGFDHRLDPTRDGLGWLQLVLSPVRADKTRALPMLVGRGEGVRASSGNIIEYCDSASDVILIPKVIEYKFGSFPVPDFIQLYPSAQRCCDVVSWPSRASFLAVHSYEGKKLQI